MIVHRFVLEAHLLVNVCQPQLATNGAELINETPKTRPDGRRYCFVHPRSTGGVLLELYEAK